MSTQNLILVYFGLATRAETFAKYAEAEGSLAFHSDEVLATLGQVIAMYPNVIIVDDAQEGAVDLVMHLRSINMSNLLILSDAPRVWDVATEEGITILSGNSSVETILATARAIATGELQAA